MNNAHLLARRLKSGMKAGCKIILPSFESKCIILQIAVPEPEVIGGGSVSIDDHRVGGVAQWLARFVRDYEVGGSNPLTPTKFISGNRNLMPTHLPTKMLIPITSP
jgi:hypothetical protein